MIEDFKKLEMFRVFSDEELVELEEYIEISDFNKGDIIIREGSEGSDTYVIKSGEVEVCKQHRTLGILGPGNVFGEMAFFDNNRRSADVVARSECSVYKISSGDFRDFIFRHHEHGVHLLFKSLQSLSDRLKQTSDHFVTVFETGKLVGADLPLAEISNNIIDILLEDIKGSFGGLILLINPYTQAYETASKIGIDNNSEQEIISFLENSDENILEKKLDDISAYAVAIKEQNRLLGYMVIAKSGVKSALAIEEEVILNTVANQIGLGILKAYNRQEELDRKRLEQSRMKRF